MNIEQLKLILETVQGMTDGAFYIALIYMVIAAMKPILLFAILFLTIKWLFKFLNNYYNPITEDPIQHQYYSAISRISGSGWSCRDDLEKLIKHHEIYIKNKYKEENVINEKEKNGTRTK
jgi:hypothetical protein